MKDNWKAKMKYWWTILYCPLYLFCFMLVEKRDVPVTIISIALDHKIPFLEVFIIPYLFWFPYIAGMFLIFFFKDKEEFLRMIKYDRHRNISSIVVMIAALRSEKVLPKKWQKAVCCIISGLIILSTVFTKQHSVLDVFAAIILAWIGYQLYYKKEKAVGTEADTVKA